jgi:septum formation protein
VSELILASASASRQRMLASAGVRFRVSAADINEAALTADLWDKGTDAAGIAAALAEQKALTVSRREKDALVLGGDSVLTLGPEIISKCRDLAALRELLRRLSGKTHQLISAAALARNDTIVWTHTGIAKLTMRPLSEAFLDSYLAAEGEAVLSSVGGYRYEGLGAQLFSAVEGDAFTIQGLPLQAVLAALRQEGSLAS